MTEGDVFVGKVWVCDGHYHELGNFFSNAVLSMRPMGEPECGMKLCGSVEAKCYDVTQKRQLLNKSSQ